MKNVLIIAIVLLGVSLMSVDFSETQQKPAATKPVQQVKFGHLNTAELLEAMPQVKQARAKLEAQRAQSVKQLETKYAQMQQMYAQAMQDAQAGRLTELQQKEIEQKLAKMQEEYANSEKTMTESLVKKEEALFKPIQDKIRAAINQVAVEKGYRFIFDSSAGILLYSRPADDVMKYVKPKVGITTK
jgi:outer membrane protein